MRIKVSSFHFKKILFVLSTILFFFYYNVVFFLHRKNFIRRHRKTFESLGGYGSANNQKFVGDLLKICLCARRIMGTNGTHLAFVELSSFFCFRMRGSILLPPRKHPEFIIIRLVICQLPGFSTWILMI